MNPIKIEWVRAILRLKPKINLKPKNWNAWNPLAINENHGKPLGNPGESLEIPGEAPQKNNKSRKTKSWLRLRQIDKNIDKLS